MNTETYIVPQYNSATGAGTLGGIAREKGITLQALLDANPQYKANPNMVRAGAQLIIPTATPAGAPAGSPAGGTPAATNLNPGGGTPGGTPTGSTPAPVKTQAQIDAEAAASSAAKAAGAAGVSIDDFSKYFSSAGLSKEETDKIKTDLGLTDAETKAFAPPAKSTEQTYNDAYSSAGLADVKTKITSLLADINTKKEQLNARLATIDENPWLSEASRSKSVQREKDFFDRTITNLTDQVNALNTVYTQGVNEVNNLVTRSSNDFKDTQALNQAKLTFLQKKAESAISTEQSSRVSKYLPAYLQAKAGAVKPETIGSAETGYYRWDAASGKFVQAIAGTGKKLTDTEKKTATVQDMSKVLTSWTGTDGFVSPDKYAELRRVWVQQSGGSAKEFDDTFAIYRNPNDDYVLAKDQ